MYSSVAEYGDEIRKQNAGDCFEEDESAIIRKMQRAVFVRI